MNKTIDSDSPAVAPVEPSSMTERLVDGEGSDWLMARVNRTGFFGGSDVPLVWWSLVTGFSSCGDGRSSFELNGGEHAKRGVSSLAVVEYLEVFKDGCGELDAGLPALAVEQLDLHPRPERLDHRVVEAVTYRSH